MVVSEVALRPATEADVEAIREVFLASFWSNYDQLETGSSDFPGYREYLIEKSRQAYVLDYKTITIAEIDGIQVGHCLYFFKPGQISDLWVHPAAQGKGVGTTLISNTLKKLKAAGVSEVEIDTHQRNAGAIKLYERMGFSIDRYEPRFSKGMQRDVPIVFLKRQL